ncbi:MAG TPA: hypothetical protein VFB04_15260 [Terriglobales bacterium]|nr:hypothetical protein [Terriglobales bacterium]
MTKLITALLALALSSAAVAFAQDNTQQQNPNNNSKMEQQSANQSAENQVNGMNTSPHHTMTGMVGDDGRTFSSNNTTWKVSNPNALKNYNGQNVTVRYQFNSDRNTIKVNKVESGQ